MGPSCATCWENENRWVSYQKATSNQNWLPTPKTGPLKMGWFLPLASNVSLKRQVGRTFPVVSSLPLAMLGWPWSRAQCEYTVGLPSSVRLGPQEGQGPSHFQPLSFLSPRGCLLWPLWLHSRPKTGGGLEAKVMPVWPFPASNETRSSERRASPGGLRVAPARQCQALGF